MSKEAGWLQRQRQGLWHLRAGGIRQFRAWRERSSTTDTNPREAQAPKLSTKIITDLKTPIIAGFSSDLYQTQQFEASFESIYWQVDEVLVYVPDALETPSFLQKPRVTVLDKSAQNISLQAGHFMGADLYEEGVLFPVDARIVYPPDYVTRLLSYLALVNYKAVVGVHGVHFPAVPRAISDGYPFDLDMKLSDLSFASYLTPFMSAFDLKQVGINFSELASHEVPELQFAQQLKSKGIPTFIIPRNSGWIDIAPPQDVVEEECEEPAIYVRDRKVFENHLKNFEPWGEKDLLTRLSPSELFPILPSSQKFAIRLLSGANSPDASLTEIIHSESFEEKYRRAEKWVQIYGDLKTRHRIYAALIEHDVDRGLTQQALKLLSKTDLAQAVAASRGVMAKYPRDVDTVRLHARLCARYFLWEEAKESYVQALRLSGAQSPESTARIMSDYFNFLVRAGDYKSAYSLTHQVKRYSAYNSVLIASLVLVYLNQGKDDDARTSLNAVCDTPDDSRLRTLEMILKGALEVHPNTARDFPGLISQELIDSVNDSAEGLTILLKIATILCDKDGALLAWQKIAAEHPDYLRERVEIGRYFDSNWQRDTSASPISNDDSCFSALDSSGSYRLHNALARLGEAEPKDFDGPKISVILTTYNAEATIDYAIRSVMNQSHANFELVVVDDKSTDGTIGVVNSWVARDPRISLIKNSTNVGPYISRNVGISHSSGDFIAIQDADDVSQHSRFETQLKYFQRDTKAVLGAHIRINNEGVVGLENDGSILGHGPVTLMFRREVLAEVGFFAEVRTRGDKEFESRLEHRYGLHAVVRIPDLLVYALDAENTNSKVELGSLEKRRWLLEFKQNYARNHAAGIYTAFSPSFDSQ